MDSSIIVKGLKKDNTALEMIKLLVKVIDKVEPCINVIVLSETIYQLTYKRKFSLEELEAFLTRFRFLEVGRSIGNLALKYMKFYKLKPNDALILATCKYYSIKYLVSLDSDFIAPCYEEEITLINSPEILEKAFPMA